MLQNIFMTMYYIFLLPFWPLLSLRSKISIKNILGITFNCADLINVPLEKAYLKGANLKGTNLSNSSLLDACLEGACLEDANLKGTHLLRANLKGVNLKNANLADTTLQMACLKGANLQGASLQGAFLEKADLEGAKGLPIQEELLKKYFVVTDEYVTVYKIIGDTEFEPAPHWVIEEGSFLEEAVLFDLREDCGPGVNFATKEWISVSRYSGDIWECRIHKEDWEGIVMPYATNGKGRCKRLQLIKVIDHKRKM